MVGSIYFVDMPYSNFQQAKARPVMVFKIIDKNDLLIMPLTTNLNREGFILKNDDIQAGSLKKQSVVIIPKITAIDSSLIGSNNFIATIKPSVFEDILQNMCKKLACS